MPTPTFLDLKTKARDWLAVDSGRISDPVLGDCINLAIRDLARGHDLWFGETNTTIGASTTGQFQLTLPTGFSRPINLEYIDGAGKRVYLVQKSWEEFTILYPELASETPGSPKHYVQFGAALAVGPPFDSDGLAIILHYYAVPTDLTAAADENPFTQFAWEAVFFRALVYATRYLIEDPRKNLWEELARESETRLIIEHSRARHAGHRLVMEEPG